MGGSLRNGREQMKFRGRICARIRRGENSLWCIGFGERVGDLIISKRDFQ